MQYGNNDKDTICNNVGANSNNNYRVWLFSKVFINTESNVAVYQGHINFRKEVLKSSQFAGSNWMSKI